MTLMPNEESETMLIKGEEPRGLDQTDTRFPLCSICLHIVNHGRDSQYYSPRFSRLRDIYLNSTRGCSLCAIFEKGIQSLWPDITITSVGDKEVSLEALGTTILVGRAWQDSIDLELPHLEFYTLPGKSEFRISLRRGNANLKEYKYLYLTHFAAVNWQSNLGPSGQVRRFAGKPTPWPLSVPSSIHGRPRHLLAETTADRCAELVTPWLERCVKNHPPCKGVNVMVSLPKRLVAVGPESNTGIHLFEHDEAKSLLQGRYAALSHCWGSTEHLTLSRATVDQRKKNIPWSQLPRTFQDAISMTRKLGLQYIWIDSLCIVQDDTDDWAIEAEKMGSIFGQAYIVIAATASVNGDGGLFFSRSPCIVIDGQNKTGEPVEAFARYRCSHNWMRKGIVSPEDDRPLLKRAWCFQEMLLGRRLLHFGGDELTYECLESVDCECGQMTEARHETWLKLHQTVYPKQHASPPSPPVATRPVHNWLLSPEPGSLETAKDEMIFESWEGLVEQYSKKSITRESDWLPALSGMASRWSTSITGTYVAGLWSRDLLYGLLWSFKDDLESLQNSPEKPLYLAPSWSWANKPRPVDWIPRYVNTAFMVEIDLRHTSCIPKGLNKFGEVSAGWLSITGAVIECMLTKHSQLGKFNVGSADCDSTTASFTVDDFSRCQLYLGKNVLGLKYCRQPNRVYGERCLLVLAPVGDIREPLALVDTVRNAPMVCRRIGITGRFPKDLWDHCLSEEKTLCII